MITADDGVRLRTWSSSVSGRPAVVLLNGGPGLPNYLFPVATMLDGIAQVHQYDQRGTGGSAWTGTHTIDRHLQDLISLLDTWGHAQVTLLGHSFGTNLACYFLLAHPNRVAGLVLLSGPFLDPWRRADQHAQRCRRTPDQHARLAELDTLEKRTEQQEIEFLALSWMTDYADPSRAWHWSVNAARTQRPVNYDMNTQLNTAKKADPLESHVSQLRALRPEATTIIGGTQDSRPASALQRLGGQLRCKVTLIPGAGHNPWIEQPSRFAAELRTAVAPISRPAPQDR